MILTLFENILGKSICDRCTYHAATDDASVEEGVLRRKAEGNSHSEDCVVAACVGVAP
jgi:hypothetical protein